MENQPPKPGATDATWVPAAGGGPGLAPTPYKQGMLLWRRRPAVATVLAGVETSPLSEAPTECLQGGPQCQGGQGRAGCRARTAEA